MRITLSVYLSDRYQLFSLGEDMSSQTTDHATHVIVHSPFSPTQAECELRRVLEPANAARLFRYTREANRRFLPVRLNTISFACNLCIPMNANGIRSRSSARFLLLRQAVQSLRFISQMLGSFSLLGCCAFSRLLSLRFQCPSVSPLFHFGGMGQ